MRKFEGTQGEWEVVLDDDCDDAVITSSCRAGMIEVAMVYGAHPESGFDAEFQQEQLANAKLIAAAPDLLEAAIGGNTPLTEIIDFLCDRLVSVYGENEGVDFIRAARSKNEKLKLAINKALGGE